MAQQEIQVFVTHVLIYSYTHALRPVLRPDTDSVPFEEDLRNPTIRATSWTAPVSHGIQRAFQTALAAGGIAPMREANSAGNTLRRRIAGLPAQATTGPDS